MHQPLHDKINEFSQGLHSFELHTFTLDTQDSVARSVCFCGLNWGILSRVGFLWLALLYALYMLL